MAADLHTNKRGVEAWWGFLAGAIIVIVVVVIMLIFFGKIKIASLNSVNTVGSNLTKLFG